VSTSPNVDSTRSHARQQSRRGYLWVGLLLGVIGLLLIGLTLLVQPESTPAFDTAVEFMNAVGRGDDALASSRLSPGLLEYVSENCPEGSVSACVDAYTPPEWGDLIQGVFRRAVPIDDGGWDVLVVSTYEDAQGFSGVCSYFRVEQSDSAATWQITRWAGFISCDESNAGLTALRDNPDAPNRAP
jgi:hypothetical protein